MRVLGQDVSHVLGQTQFKKNNMDKVAEPNWSSLLQQVAAQRDRRAYTLLFNHFAPRLKSFGLKLLKQEHLALEMVQDTMLNVWLKAHLFNPDKGAASTWIYTIARNVRYDILRKASQKKEDNISDELWPIIVESASNDFIEFTELENLLLQGELSSFFDKISQSQLEVIKRVYLQEKSQQEVADELNIPLGTVKSRIRLALTKLQTVMEKAHD